MTLYRDYSDLPHASLFASLSQIKLPAVLLWRLERFLCWFLAALGYEPSGHSPKEVSPLGIDFELHLPIQSIAMVDDLIAFEITERTPFSPDDILGVYRLEPSGNDILVKVAILPLADVPETDYIPLSGGMVYSPSASRNVWHLFSSPAVMGLFVILLAGMGSSAVLEHRLAKAEATLKQSSVQFRDAAHKAVALRTQRDETRAMVATASRIRAGIQPRIVIMTLLSETLPKLVWLSQLEISGDTVRINGYAPSAADVVSRLDAVPEFLRPRFVAPVAVDETGLETFSIEFSTSEGEAE